MSEQSGESSPRPPEGQDTHADLERQIAKPPPQKNLTHEIAGDRLQPKNVDRPAANPSINFRAVAEYLAGENTSPAEVAQYEAALKFLRQDNTEVRIEGDILTARHLRDALEPVQRDSEQEGQHRSAIAKVRGLLGRFVNGSQTGSLHSSRTHLPSNDEINKAAGLTLPDDSDPGRTPEPRPDTDASAGAEPPPPPDRNDRPSPANSNPHDGDEFPVLGTPPSEQRERVSRPSAVTAAATLVSLLAAVTAPDNGTSDTPFVQPGSVVRQAEAGVPADSIILHKSINATALLEWARHFDRDPKAREMPPAVVNEVTHILDDVQNEVNKGKHVTGIKVRGYTSDDDDSRHPLTGERTGGLGEIDTRRDAQGKNEQTRLGDTRRTAYGALLNTMFDMRGITHPQIENLPSIEHVLKPTDIATVDKIAKGAGLDRLALEEGYNRGTVKLSPEAQQQLFEFLDQYRKAEATITMEKPGEPPVTIIRKSDVPLYAVLPLDVTPQYPQQKGFREPKAMAPQHTAAVGRHNKGPEDGNMLNEGGRNRKVKGGTRIEGQPGRNSRSRTGR